MTATPLQPPEGIPGWAWDQFAAANGSGWYIAERDAAGAVIGTAIRYADGRKDFQPGGKRGLIYAHPLPEDAGRSAEKPIYVCEGASDTAALISLGLEAVGTPMAGHSAVMLADLLHGRHAVIVADADEAGRRGARTIADALLSRCASVRIIEPPEGAKDARAAVIACANRVDFLELARQAEPESPAPIDAPVVPRFDMDAVFPSRATYAKDYLAALSRSTQTPEEMPALLGLAIASAAVCNVARVRGHGDHVEPAQLWGMVLCEPAVRKSAVLSELLAPILGWEKRRAEELGPVIAAAVQRWKIDEKRLKSIEEHAARAADSQQVADLTGEAVRLFQAMQAEPVPTPPVLLASEPTPEALARQMAANCGRALLASAEADALDIVQGRYSGTRNYGILLKGHAGDAVRATRVGRPGDTIDHPALAVALCVQPQAVRELWADPNAEGRGLLARFAVVLPRDRIGCRDVRPPCVPVAARTNWQAAIDRLLTFEPSDSPVEVGLGADADALYHDFQRRTEAALGVGDLADRQAWGGKLCGLLLRVALTLHALETWAIRGRPDDFPTIDAATMRAAIAWADYLASAELHAREVLGESPEGRESRRLVEWIDRKGGVVTVRDLTHGVWAYRGDPVAAERALSRLAADGIGTMEWGLPGSRGGRPTKQFRLVGGTKTTTPLDETPSGAPVNGGFGYVDAGVKTVAAGSKGGGQ